MLYSLPVCVSFWLSVWAGPFQSLIGSSFVDPLLALDLPRWPVVRRIGCLRVLRLVALGVTQRLAWMQEHGVPILPRFGPDSFLDWEDFAAKPCSRLFLTESSKEHLRWYYGLLLDVLMRLLAAPPDAATLHLRVTALVGICERIARVYAELRHRFGVAQARAIIAEDLLHYLGPQAKVA